MSEAVEKFVLKNVITVDTYGRTAPFYDSGHSLHSHLYWDDETQSPKYLQTWDGYSFHKDNKCFSVSFEKASPEVMKTYNDHVAAKARRQSVQGRWTSRQNMIALARDIHVPNYRILKSLRYEVGQEKYELITQTVKSFIGGRLKNSFKKSIALQVLEWLNEPEKRAKYKIPLSPKQLSAIQPYQQNYYRR